MASSVLSEQAFSSTGITITKQRNRLTHDIVKALQILKAAIREDILFRPDQPSKAVELTLLLEQVEEFDTEEPEAGANGSEASEDTATSSDASKKQVEEDIDIVLGTESDGICAITLSA
jgi:hypothetical protein